MPASLAMPRPASAPIGLAPLWDTEVFLLRGEDRGELLERVRGLVDEVERQPQAGLTELAARLATGIAPGGLRLGIVAGSPAELIRKLRRAAGRLADPDCRQIRDTAGLYFTAEPLYPGGAVAWLYPGEGAQYAGMLADLCAVFPEVAETFDWCDRVAAEAGRPSLRSVLHPPPGETEAAEARLRRLGPSIFGVLLADLALTRLLHALGVPVAAVAGHSAGELAALVAAGAIDTAALVGPRLVAILDLMERLEDEAGGGPDVILLAVGAGRAVVREVAGAVAGEDVVVAMDNCPHQCVAVGPAEAVAAVETALLARGLVCERLPFRRPYHTPLFEPWMGPFRDLFAGIPFARPRLPVYSCSTGGRFPDDPAAVRELAVSHWVSPVEFVRLVETLYADGVRVFVEAGPRGNLSAFVEDILRGRPFVAVPANVPRRSGPTQVNHLVAQLVVHHVPVDLGRLFAGRAGPAAGASHSALPPTPPAPSVVTPSAQVLHAHFDLMERFLDVQRDVFRAYLSGAHPDGIGVPVGVEAELGRIAGPGLGSGPMPAFLGQVVRHDPGRELVARRPLDRCEDLFADDHTLGGRGVSRIDPKQNGLPVLPMTFSLEAMAAAASVLVPGKVVVAFRDVRLYRWVPYDPEPTTLEVRVRVVTGDPAGGPVTVAATVRDLGNSFLPDGATKPAAEATLVLAAAYPPPPPPLPFRLTDERPCRSSVEDLRRNMFHGPLFQMIRSLDRWGPEGIEGTLEVHPRNGWFRSNPAPHTLIDPVLVDAAMHILGAWHLEQPDWSGRILLPIGVKSLEFYSPPPPVGSRLLVRGHNEEETARQARHGVEVFGPDGRLWYRLCGAAYWRFYLPFGHVNFFGPKDEYFLCMRVTGVESDRPGTFARCYYLDPPADLQQPVLRASGVRVSMTPREIAAFQSLTGSEADKSQWFFSRLAAKDAVRAAWSAKYGISTFPADIETEVSDGRFVCRPRGSEPLPEPYPPVAVATDGSKMVACAAFAERVGVGLVPVGKNEAGTEAVLRAARLALADALRLTPGEASGLPAAAGSQPGEFHVSYRSRVYRVRAVAVPGAVVAATLCEVVSS